MMCKTAPDRPTGRITATAPRMRMGMDTLIIGGRDSGSMGAAGMGDAAGAGRTGLLACPHQEGIISMMKAVLVGKRDCQCVVCCGAGSGTAPSRRSRDI